MSKSCVMCLILISAIFIQASGDDNKRRLYMIKRKTVDKSDVNPSGVQKILNRHRRQLVTDASTVQRNPIIQDTRPCILTSFVHGCVCREGDVCSYNARELRRQYKSLTDRYHGWN
ncbi:hypothetical protein ILUMI_27142 [Ignelater luminosus]|uniref:Secreted protein n=1 Tax=Ignelater luminosus TaxID=2038154 RepID=A0A8K0C6T0_IGNLU|nr:hypothetical protein ILUMI_27142 [Ignelater luminosus]